MPDPLASPPAPPRRRFRLSLRALMILVLVIALPAGWVANTVRTQRQAIATVRAAGGRVRFDYQSDQVGTNKGRPVYRTEPAAPAWARRWLGDELFQAVVSVSFKGRLTPETLAAVGRFARLEEIRVADLAGVGAGLSYLRGLPRLGRAYLVGPGITDAMLADLAQVSSLRTLEIGNSDPTKPPALDRIAPATDAGFARLAGLANLEALAIADCPGLSDEGGARLVAGLPSLRHFALHHGPKSLAWTLSALARHHPNLEALHIHRTEVVDDDFKAVEALTKLRGVSLQNSSIGDAGVSHLRPLRDLTGLILSGTNVTDAGLAALEGLPNLERLYLSNTRISDTGVGRLAGMPRLRRLFMHDITITDAAMPAIARIASLEFLDLTNARGLTDAGLVPLRSLRNLQQLSIAGTKVTPEGVAVLQQAVPSLTRVTLKPARPAAPRPALK